MTGSISSNQIAVCLQERFLDIVFGEPPERHQQTDLREHQSATGAWIDSDAHAGKDG
jgi:hypothetical protein